MPTLYLSKNTLFAASCCISVWLDITIFSKPYRGNLSIARSLVHPPPGFDFMAFSVPLWCPLHEKNGKRKKTQIKVVFWPIKIFSSYIFFLNIKVATFMIYTSISIDFDLLNSMKPSIFIFFWKPTPWTINVTVTVKCC